MDEKYYMRKRRLYLFYIPSMALLLDNDVAEVAIGQLEKWLEMARTEKPKQEDVAINSVTFVEKDGILAIYVPLLEKELPFYNNLVGLALPEDHQFPSFSRYGFLLLI
ncbi:hypothetical protein TorRG33x02_238860 [Trema orientale]|uniref:Uncharacterized protein n=1 Tax=Trema orientale TaxID=63057 RepID=A0A2P5DYA9_TREOI|nr:hypothetical protein TorRG33x02_238860 [Trema orientale]